MNKDLCQLLERLARHDGCLLESQIVGSGGRASQVLNDALIVGLVDITAHPTVKERGMFSVPAAAVVLTEKGRSALTTN